MKKNKKKKDTPIIVQGNETKISRRGFISRLWSFLGLIAGLEIIAIIFAYLSPTPKRIINASKQIIDAGIPGDYKNGTVTPFRGGRFFLARLDDGGFIAMSLRCSHLGCSISWYENENLFICPCHSSSFDISGNVLSPPAPNALDLYPVYLEAGKLKVDIGRIVKRKYFQKSQAIYV